MFQTAQDEIKIAQIKFYEGVSGFFTRHQKPVVAQPVTSKEMVSNTDFWHDPEIEKLCTEVINPIRGKATEGWICCAHVMAFLSGKECQYNRNWDKEMRKASNALSMKLVGLKIYPEIKDDVEIEEYAYRKEHPAIVITNGMIEEAAKRFPCDKVTIDQEWLKTMAVDYTEPNFTTAEGPTPKPEEGKKEDPPKAEPKQEPPKDEAPKAEPEKEQPQQEEPKAGPTVTVTPDEEEEEKKAESPIFNYDNMNLPPEYEFIEVTAAQKRDVQNIFGKFIGNRTYQLNRIPSGYIQMVINAGDSVRSIVNIDPGLFIGNGYNVVGIIPGSEQGQYDQILVHCSEEEIVEKIFDNPYYLLTPDEITKCMKHMFMNTSIYHWIDMSNMKARLEKLSKDEFKKLGKKFTFIINTLEENDRARFRINDWKSIDEFSMISDKKCKSPFPGLSSETISGMEIQIKGDEIGITWPGTNVYKTFKIDDYGIL